MVPKYDVCVVGGCGRVGLPLALSFARQGMQVAIHDINTAAIDLLKARQMPFMEENALEVLRSVMGVRLHVENNPGLISESAAVIVVIGTPVDEHLNPRFLEMKSFMESLVPYLVEGQLLILRSTLYPGVSQKIHDLLAKSGLNVELAFCPERVAEGKSMTELIRLPQIISGFGNSSIERAEALFRRLGCATLRLSPLEAELAKISSTVGVIFNLRRPTSFL